MPIDENKNKSTKQHLKIKPGVEKSKSSIIAGTSAISVANFVYILYIGLIKLSE